MSKATVVSFEPKLMNSYKPGLYPGYFTVPPAKDGVPGILHVSNSVHYIENLNGHKVQVETSAEKVAESIVADHIRSTMGVAEGTHPAFFWVEGHKTAEEILKQHADDVKRVKAAQRSWHLSLVRFADDEWARHRQHRAITDTQRNAAKALGLTKEWALSEEDIGQELKRCPLCQSKINVKAVICPICRSDLSKKG